MNDRMKRTFTKVHAEDELIARTRFQIGHALRRRAYRRTGHRLAAACASLFILLSLAGFFAKEYLAPISYIDLDINPSIELVVNRFGRVITASAYSEDSELILGETDVWHLSYQRALDKLIAACAMHGYMDADGFVSVTLRSDDGRALLSDIQNSVDAALTNHHIAARTDIFLVSSEIKATANAHHISPAKYLAITELQKVDPSATFESCRDHSINELRQSIDDHRQHQESGYDESVKPEVITPESTPQIVSPTPTLAPESNGHNHNRRGHSGKHD